MSGTRRRGRRGRGRRALAALVGVALALGAIVLPAGPAAARDPDIRIRGLEDNARLEAEVARLSRSAHDVAAAWFGLRLESEVQVIWIARHEDWGQHGIREAGAVAGLADAAGRRVFLFAPALRARPQRTYAILLHEFCHLFVGAATARAELEPPRWLNEGIAMWVSGEWDLGLDWRADHANRLTDARAAGSLIPFEDLDATFPSGPFFQLAYAQSLSFVEWLVEREGEDGLRALLRRFDRDLEPDEALERVYGLTLAEAEAEWRDTLGGAGWLRFLPSGSFFWGLFWSLLGLLVVVGYIRTRVRLGRLPDDEEPPPGPAA